MLKCALYHYRAREGGTAGYKLSLQTKHCLSTIPLIDSSLLGTHKLQKKISPYGLPSVKNIIAYKYYRNDLQLELQISATRWSENRWFKVYFIFIGYASN